MISRFYILSIVIFIFLFSSAAAAATYTVDRTDDVAGASACTAAANDCSLRGAINNANANGAGADIINFNVGGGNAQTITMSSTPLPDIQTSLTIDGTTQPLFGGLPLIEINGAASIINTNGFKFTSPVGNTPLAVIIKSLTINRFMGNGIFFGASSGITATVVGCHIGTNPGGTVDLGNGTNGIRINAYPNSAFTIGGTAVSERNVISGNQNDGVNIVSAQGLFDDANTTITILNNFIGVSAAGNADLGNTANGISFDGGTPSIGYTLQIGNGLPNGRNIVSGNDSSGIAATTGIVTVVGNYIGTSLSGNAKIGNMNGIKLSGNVAAATVGGTILGINAGNVISGNDVNGILIDNAAVPAVIRRNLIGTNAAGTGALGNGDNGVQLSESDTATNSSIVIGSDTSAADGNTISGNTADGIDVEHFVRQVKIYANRIGTNDAATAKIPNNVGIRLASSQNEVGLAGNNAAANVISGNGSGFFVVGSLANGNKISNNYVGTNAAGANLGNTQFGIYINQSALGNQIGNGAAAGANQIAFNGQIGVDVADGTLNVIRANSIYSNAGLGIDLNSDGVTLNDAGDADAGPNGRQNFPVIQRATPSRITAFLNSMPDEHFDIDFYRVDSCDASGYGQGRYYLGTLGSQLTDPNTGIVNLSFPTSLSVGQFVTATATFAYAGAGDTSEFSQCVAVTPEPGNLSFSAATYTTAESAAMRTIVVNRSGGSGGTISVDYATSNGTATAGQDYTAKSGTLTFGDGEIVKSFDIPINNDVLDEADETVNLTLANSPPGVFLTPNAAAILTITDNDAPPTVSITDVSQPEGNLGQTQFSFRVQLSGASSFPVSVDYVTAPGTATASSDFAAAGGQVNFAPGETLKSVLVTVIGDLTPELDETFFVDLSNPVNASLSDNQALGTILDDDNPGKFSFSFAPYAGTEHDSVTITIARTGGAAGTVSVDYATAGGTASPISDYTPVAGTLVFADGETTKTFNVSLADDNLPEPSENVNLILSNPIGGAILGAPAAAVLNILDNDSGALLIIGGEIRKPDNTPLAGATVNLTGAGSATTATDASGRYSFANLAPNGNYAVTPAALGYTFNPLNRQYANLSNDDLNANFTATAAPSRQLRAIGGNAAPGQNVQVTIELVAQGDENSAGFSLNFDPAILTNPQVALAPDAATGFLTVNNSQTGTGKLGVLLAMPFGQKFTAGTRSLVTIAFNTLPTAVYNSPVTFGDVPIARQIANSNADPLPANYLDGAVTFAQGYEADVAPRPTGNNNGTIAISDFTQIGRFVAGLDTLNPSFNEFQRADSAPRVSLGNGVLTVSDYTQAGRYAAGLDVVTPTGGQSAPSLAGAFFVDARDAENSFFVPTAVRVVGTQAAPGSQVIVSIETDALGTENGFGFTLNYDAGKLSNPLVSLGSGVPAGAALIPNTSQSGKAGVVLGMPFGQALTAGTKQLVTVRFDVAANASGGNTPLTFGDTPVFREISDVGAGVLSSTFQDGSINILGPTSAVVPVSGRVLTADGRGIGNALVLLTDQNGAVRTAATGNFGYYLFEDVEVGQTYTITVLTRRFSFGNPTRIVSITEELTEVDFVADPL